MAGSLREGFTTGTAAAAAAYAAVNLLCGRPLPEMVETPLPPFSSGTALAVLSGAAKLAIPVDCGGLLPCGTAWASVIKDGGDDPDATHGARLVAHASFSPFADSGAGGCDALPDTPSFAGPDQAVGSASPSPPIVLEGESGQILLRAGTGIGRVTLPGLPVAVGEAAVNPEPRKQIAAAVSMAASACGFSGTIHLLISVPDGEARARHTLNSRLGVLGGISVLGTSGIVRPYSHDAWKCAIEQGIGVASALGLKELLLSTGRRSERLGFALYPFLPPQAGIQVADFAAFSLRKIGVASFSRIFWVCFPGKLLKLAQGLEWTHAGAGAADIPLLADLGRQEGAGAELASRIADMPTAVGAFALLEEHGRELHDAVLLRLGRMAYANLRGWLLEARSGPAPGLSMTVFSTGQEPLLTIEDGEERLASTG